MKYMLLCYDDEGGWKRAGQAAIDAARKEAVGLCRELHAKGQYIEAAPLHSDAMGARVQMREGKSSVTTGPFAETREVLGGYYLIEVADLDEAIEIAARHPGARLGTVEIRPIVELPNLPKV
jgi:hypothetical protein